MFQFQLKQSQWWTVSCFINVKGESDLGIFCVISECAALINKHHRRKYNFSWCWVCKLCFLSTTIPMFCFWQMIQMGPIFFFKSDISKHKNPSRAYQIRPDEAPVVSRHQGSPPSVALSVMLVDYSLDCKGLKGRDWEICTGNVHKGRKEIYCIGLSEWRWLIWKQHSNKAQEHKRTLNIKLRLNIFRYYADYFVHVFICPCCPCFPVLHFLDFLLPIFVLALFFHYFQLKASKVSWSIPHNFSCDLVGCKLQETCILSKV